MNLWPFCRRQGPSREAQNALDQGRRARRDAERLHEHVEEVARQSAEIRRRNNFGAAVEKAFRGA